MKKCRDCKTEKEDFEFYVRKSNSDGLYSYCKECSRKQLAERYEKNKEKYLTSQKEYRKINIEIHRKRARDYYYKNRDHKLKKSEEYRKKNKKEISFREALRRIKDKERFEKNRKRHLSWSKYNRESINEYQRQWYQKNKEKRRAHVILNRAIVAGKIMRPKKCSECQKKCKPDGHHEDYSKPLDVSWICRACHSRKSPRTVIK